MEGKKIDKYKNKKYRSSPKTTADSLYQLSFPLCMCTTVIIYKTMVMKRLIGRDQLQRENRRTNKEEIIIKAPISVPRRTGYCGKGLRL